MAYRGRWHGKRKARKSSYGKRAFRACDFPRKCGKSLPVYEKQPVDSPTPYAAMIQKNLGNMDWSKTAVELERLIRGLNPWPSAYTKLDGKTFKIWKAKVVKGKTDVHPGCIFHIGKIVTIICSSCKHI